MRLTGKIIIVLICLFCTTNSSRGSVINLSSLKNNNGATGAPDNKGREFMIGFMDNLQMGKKAYSLELFITTSHNSLVNVRVHSPKFGFLNTKFTVVSGKVKHLNIPFRCRMVGTALDRKGILITADYEMIVYGVNKQMLSSDAFLALPVDILGTEYYTVTYYPPKKKGQFLIVGVHDCTNIQIKLPSGTNTKPVVYKKKRFLPGSTISLTLNRFDTFQLQGKGDLTSAYISSDKPISVFSGNLKTNTGKGKSQDHLVEHLLPVNTWGKTFATVPTPMRTVGDLFKIIASKDKTKVSFECSKKNGYTSYHYKLTKAGDFKQVLISSDEYCHIKADNGIFVVQFILSQQNPSEPADPSMMIIPPIEQYAADYTFTTPKYSYGSYDNYFMFVVKSSEKKGLKLDGAPFPESTKYLEIPRTNYVAGYIKVRDGSHTVRHDSSISGFGGYLFGKAKLESYAFVTGMRLAKINEKCIESSPLPGDGVDNDCDGLIDEELCTDENNSKDDDGDGLFDEDCANPPQTDQSAKVGSIKFSHIESDSVTLTWSPPMSNVGPGIQNYEVKVSEDHKKWRTLDSVDKSVTTYTVKHLKEGRTYYFKISAIDDAGLYDSPISQIVLPKRPVVVPSKPVGPLKVTDIQEDSVSIQWQPPQKDGSSAITGYVVEKRDTKTNKYTVVERVGKSTNHLKVRHLQTGTGYFFQVKAQNEAGTGEPLVIVTPVVPKSPFGKPSSPVGPIKVSDVTQKSAKIEWEAPKTDGGSPVTEYIIELRESDTSLWVIAGNLDGKTTSFLVHDLEEGAQYFFRVIAVNSEGKSPPLESLLATKTLTKIVKPSSPVGPLIISDVTQNSAKLKWRTPQTDGGSPIIKYIIRVRQKNTNSWKEAGTAGKQTTEFKVNGLQEGTEYYFQIIAANSKGHSSALESMKVAKTLRKIVKPSSPEGPLIISDVTQTSAKLKWQTPENNGGSSIIQYIIELRQSNALAWEVTGKVGTQATTFQVQGLKEDTEYYFRVIAVNSVGQSPALESSEATKTLKTRGKPSSPVGPLIINDVTQTTTKIKWQAPETDGGAPITEYIIECRQNHQSSWDIAGKVDNHKTSFQVDGLNEGTEYYFRVIAVNSEGQSTALGSLEAIKTLRNIAVRVNPITRCFDGYTLSKELNICFKFNKTFSTWHRSLDVCESDGGTLVTINSQRKYQIVKGLIKEKVPRDHSCNCPLIWIGGNDVREEGKFVWTNGDNVSFSKWGYKQPDDRSYGGIRRADCILVNVETDLWWDRDCAYKIPFVCEHAPVNFIPEV